jgi:hypothetical protein
MTEQQFKDKYIGNLDGWWAEDCSRIFWARSYKMPVTDLIEMSVDFLKSQAINGHSCSSHDLAHRTLTRHHPLYKEYGLAGLYSEEPKKWLE